MVHNIALTLRETVQKKQDQVAVVEVANGREYSFNSIERRSNELAWKLQKAGVSPGDRAMLLLRPSAECICYTFALFKVGAPVILIDPGMGYRNLLRCIESVRPALFIGIPQAHLFRFFCRKPFRTIRKSFWVLPSKNRSSAEQPEYPVYEPQDDDLAAIVFTTGSTGPPKGVRYEHTIFATQLEHIRSYYKIGGDDCDQPAFPLFALFSVALGASAVIPDMDPTRPAKVNPELFVDSLKKYRVTYSFGSPALWNVVSSYCEQRKIVLDSLTKVLMAGAPVSGELIERLSAILPENAEIHIPYGATEALPVISANGRDIVAETWQETKRGRGYYVGTPLPGVEIRIIRIDDNAIPEVQEEMLLPPGEIGEILVTGDVVTRAYENRPDETAKAKTLYAGRMWHRMGDTGFLDESGRLWFCGRKAHRVRTEDGKTHFSVCCEAVINRHPAVFRSALVGIPAGEEIQEPVIILELTKGKARSRAEEEIILSEVRKIAENDPLTEDIREYLLYSDFPVDIRHNAKIFREKLSVWATGRICGK